VLDDEAGELVELAIEVEPAPWPLVEDEAPPVPGTPVTVLLQAAKAAAAARSVKTLLIRMTAMPPLLGPIARA